VLDAVSAIAACDPYGVAVACCQLCQFCSDDHGPPALPDCTAASNKRKREAADDADDDEEQQEEEGDTEGDEGPSSSSDDGEKCGKTTGRAGVL
jgi:hypothetical protein